MFNRDSYLIIRPIRTFGIFIKCFRSVFFFFPAPNLAHFYLLFYSLFLREPRTGICRLCLSNGNIAKMCFQNCISTQALIDIKQKRYHKIYYVFKEGIFDANFPDNHFVLRTLKNCYYFSLIDPEYNWKYENTYTFQTNTVFSF